MRCSVQGCKNDSRHSCKSQGITFHTFPTDPTHCAAWLRAINRSTWSPRDRSAVCSAHFLPDDLYVTKNGMKKVRAGAVPYVEQDFHTYNDNNIPHIRACRICLVTEQRLFSIKTYHLGGAFERLTGLSPSSDERLPQHLCSECAQRLLNADTLRSKSLRAQNLMLDILNRQELITIEKLKSIDRASYFLNSPLQTTILYNPYNFEFSHTPTKIEGNTNQESLVLEVDNIKNEDQFNNKCGDVFTKSNGYVDNSNDLFVDKCSDLFVDKSNELFVDKSNDVFVDKCNDYVDKNNEIFINKHSEILVDKNEFIQKSNEIFVDAIKEFSEAEADNDDDFEADKEFESDDSLPLEIAKKKKKKDKDETKKRRKEKTTTKKVRKKVEKPPAEPKIDRRRKPFLNQDLNETLFTVTNLTFEEQIAEIEKRQESDNYKHSVFKCNECYKGFLDQDAYNGHMMRHTDECGEHKCEICKTHFKHSHALRKHITAHHTQRFSCNQCPYVTTHRQTARLHERWHKGTRYKCPHCPEEFVKFTTYMGHVRIKHPSDFVCALCGYSFVSGKGIELHKKLKHRHADTIPEDGPYCEVCDVRFVSREAYKKHLSVSARHSTQGTREANKAGRRVTREKQSKPEEEQEEGEDRRTYPSQMRKAEGPIPCEQCGLQLEDSRAYHGHFRRAHPDKNRTKYPSMKSPCMCELCGRIFQSYALLKDHTWVHTGERPFKCSECGKSFRMKQRLVAHRRVHALVKASYVCSVCGKHFSTHSNRQRHMFIHTGLKPYKCEMCGKGFKHASEKRAHVTYVHLKKPWPKRSRGKRQARQGSVPPQEEAPPMELGPAWGPCEPKLPEINIMHDKPVYYNLKI